MIDAVYDAHVWPLAVWLHDMYGQHDVLPIHPSWLDLIIEVHVNEDILKGRAAWAFKRK